MTASGNGKHVRRIARVVLLAAFAHFMATGFRRGWSQLSTDFPNYYTAAVALRHPTPLRSYYDWTSFAREMNLAGVGQQVGAYTPQTPLTMLPMVGLTNLSALQAKRVWLIANLLLLAAAIGLLARSTGLWWEQIALLAFCGYGSLANNFAYGQYYVFLLFLVTLTYYCFSGQRQSAGGFVSGVAFALKLYTGPLLLYFAAKRKWSAALGMLAALGALGVLTIAIFGEEGVMYYLTHVLPRTLEGGSIDPYHPGVPALSTMLHHLFLREPGLNPNPLWNAPWLFFAARSASALGLVLFTTLGVAAVRDSDSRQDVSWFVIALLLLSTSTASYTFLLLLVPASLLLQDAPPWKSAYLAVSYILLNVALKPEWLFPKVWLLLLWYIVAGARYLRAIPVRWTIGAAGGVLILSLIDARWHMMAYSKEPGRRYPQIAVERGALFSGYPAITRSGLFYQGMGRRATGEPGWVLRWAHDGAIESIGFPGSVLHPTAPGPDGPVWFDLASHGSTTTMAFGPRSETSSAGTISAGLATSPATSPDGRWAVVTESSLVGEELWIQEQSTGRMRQVAGGNCNNTWPAWELDSSAIVFASDCGRAFGLPALYRARIAE